MTRTDAPTFLRALRFPWLTPFYDDIVRATTRERTFKRALIQQAAIEPGQRVLDLACGTGTLAIWLKEAQPSAEVIGVDADPAILSIAKRKVERAGMNIQLDTGYSYDLPYPDAHFDRVLSSLFLHHLTWPEKQRTTRELFRVTKPGGQLHIADWGYPTSPIMRFLFFFVQFFDGFHTTRDNVSGRLIELFQTAGFSHVEQNQTFSTLLGTMAIFRAVKPL